MTVHCPCCGQPVHAGRTPVEALRDAPLTPQERRIIEALAKAYPRAVDRAHLIDALYFDDPEGGSEWAGSAVGVLLSRIRKKIPAYGWTIPSCKSGNGNLGSYRLEALT